MAILNRLKSGRGMRILPATVAAAILVVSCSSGGPSSSIASPAAASAPNPPTTAAQVDAIDLQGKNVEVAYWHNRPQQDQDLLQSMLDQFNQTNPYGITADAESAGASYNDVYNKVNAAIAAGQPPEMSVAYQNQAAFYAASGAVVDLTPFLESTKYGLSQADQNDYIQAFLNSDENPQFKNARLGFPTQRSMDVMYYNADWLRQLGYSQPPQDWQTWEQVACQASDPAQGKYGWAVQHDASTFAAALFGHGGNVLASDASGYTFNDPAGVATLSMMQRMFQNKCAVEVPTSERNGEQNRFGAGQALFVFASSSALTAYQQAVSQNAGFQWDIAMPPFNGTPAINLYGASISVYKTTPEKELAAWLVLKYLGETAQTAKWASNTGYLPVRESAKQQVVDAFHADPKWAGVADSYARMFDWAPYSKIEAPVAGYDSVRDLIDRQLMTRAMTDFSFDPKQALDAVVQQSDQVLQQNAPKP